MLRTAARAFAREVRKYDPYRIIVSGNAAPQTSAWHQRVDGSWSQDTREQYAEMLRKSNPDPLDMISTHEYNLEKKRFQQQVSFKEFLHATLNIARRTDKPLSLGEFGTSKKDGHKTAKKKNFTGC